MYQELLKMKFDLGFSRPFKKETAQILKKLDETDHIYGNLSLEGTELSRKDIEGMIEGEIPRTASLKECIFVKNYLTALEVMRDNLALRNSLDKRLLLKFYNILTGQAEIFRKSGPVDLEFRHVPPHHSEVESRLSTLLQSAYKDRSNEIRSASRIHCGILDIRPFEKCNGIMARFAMNYYLEEKGFLPVALRYNQDEYTKTMIQCLRDRDDALFFWGLERAEYNKLVQVLQIAACEEE